jgi:hypothetical protein
VKNHPDLPKNAPEWLRDADIENPRVEMKGDLVVWHGGEFRGGEFRGGAWRGGEWFGGEWFGGEWFGGEWHRGVWRDPSINRLKYHATLAGIEIDGDRCVGWRSTRADGTGRYTKSFVQPEGDYYEDDADPAGHGVCWKGIHVTSRATAFTYFGIDRSAQLWRVEFHIDDLLDCDGEKARIRGGTFAKAEWPFLTNVERSGDFGVEVQG